MFPGKQFLCLFPLATPAVLAAIMPLYRSSSSVFELFTCQLIIVNVGCEDTIFVAMRLIITEISSLFEKGSISCLKAAQPVFQYAL